MAKQIVIEHLFKVFGDAPERALDLARQGVAKQDIVAQTGQSIGVFDASFTIEPGEIFVVMGLSGSGKSTLVRMFNRLIEPTAGRIVVDGEDIAQYNDKQLRDFRRKHISMVFQSFALLPHLTVLQNTAFGLELAGVPLGEREAAARAALEQVGLAVWAASYPDELSGGMQQRVGLARALAADPSILLMDEAFSALDPIIRTEMQDELLRLQQVKRRTIVFISHDLDEAMRIGDRVAIMKDGQVVQVGTPEEILRQPADDYVRQFVRGVDQAAVFKAGDIARKTQVEVSESPTRGCRIGGEERIACSGSKHHNLAFFQILQGFGAHIRLHYLLDGNRRHHAGGEVRLVHRVGQCQGIHDGGQHAHVIGRSPVHAISTTRDTAKDVAAANHHRHLHAHSHDFGNLFSHAHNGFMVDAEGIRPHEGFARKLQQHSFDGRMFS